MKWRRALLPASRDKISLTGASQNLVRPEFLRKSRRPRLPEGHGGYRGRGGVGGDQLSQYRQAVPRVDDSVRVRFAGQPGDQRRLLLHPLRRKQFYGGQHGELHAESQQHSLDISRQQRHVSLRRQRRIHNPEIQILSRDRANDAWSRGTGGETNSLTIKSTNDIS